MGPSGFEPESPAPQAGRIPSYPTARLGARRADRDDSPSRDAVPDRGTRPRHAVPRGRQRDGDGRRAAITALRPPGDGRERRSHHGLLTESVSSADREKPSNRRRSARTSVSSRGERPAGRKPSNVFAKKAALTDQRGFG